MYRESIMRFGIRAIAVIPLLLAGASAQSWDPGSWPANTLDEDTGHKLTFNVEERVRAESRTGNSFGKSGGLAPLDELGN